MALTRNPPAYRADTAALTRCRFTQQRLGKSDGKSMASFSISTFQKVSMVDPIRLQCTPQRIHRMTAMFQIFEGHGSPLYLSRQ